MAKQQLVEVTIFRGTYVTADGEIPQGQSVEVEPKEAERLKALGVVKPDDYQAPPEVQDGTLKVSTADGVTIGPA